jgi:hypothetical protein
MSAPNDRREGHAMFRKSIITLAAAAALCLVALASASAHWGGGHRGGHMGGFRMGGFHHMGGFRHIGGFRHMGGFHHVGAFHMRAYPRFAFRHRVFVHRFAVIRGPIFVGNGCWRVHWVRIHRHWEHRHAWVCG